MASKEALHQYVGRYYSPELETFYTIALKNDTLQLVHIHHGESRLNAIATDRLQASWWFVQSIEMVRNADKVITGLRMSNGRVRNLWFRRLPDDFGEEKLPIANK
ncbi:hypothetical protein GCM10023189_49240 [Nibrella saemangeumensis]|uniref:Uncharacterized protein n=1 Tax=Nibrella saemangeumensis TaxID=1084526 RepID=A0ABP8NG29_9BACT